MALDLAGFRFDLDSDLDLIWIWLDFGWIWLDLGWIRFDFLVDS